MVRVVKPLRWWRLTGPRGRFGGTVDRVYGRGRYVWYIRGAAAVVRVGGQWGEIDGQRHETQTFPPHTPRRLPASVHQLSPTTSENNISESRLRGELEAPLLFCVVLAYGRLLLCCIGFDRC